MKRLIVGLTLLLLFGNACAAEKNNWFFVEKEAGNVRWTVGGYQSSNARNLDPHVVEMGPHCLIHSYYNAPTGSPPAANSSTITVDLDLRTGGFTFTMFVGSQDDWYFLKDKPRRGVDTYGPSLVTMALYKNDQFVASQVMKFWVIGLGGTSTEDISSDFQKAMTDQADEMFLLSTNYPDTSLEIDFQGIRPFLFQSLSDCAKAYQK
jgi:hypothetical protein